MSSSPAPTMTAKDVAARTLSVVSFVVVVSAYIALAIALFPVVDRQLGGWFTVVCWIAVMAILTNLFVPVWSFVAGLWLSGSPKRRHAAQTETKRQRDQLALMTARSRQQYGEAGPPESMSGDVSENQVRNRDAGAGRRR